MKYLLAFLVFGILFALIGHTLATLSPIGVAVLLGVVGAALILLIPQYTERGYQLRQALVLADSADEKERVIKILSSDIYQRNHQLAVHFNAAAHDEEPEGAPA